MICYLRYTLVLAILTSSATTICGEGTQGGNVVNIVKTGDYEGKSTAEPYKITTLSLSTDNTTNLADYDEIKWQISFKPVDDEIWPEYQQDVLSEEVAGHSIVETTATGTSSAISHMFKLPGVYHVKVVGSKSTSNGRRMKSKKELEGKVPKGKKSKKIWEVEDVFASSEVRVRYARRDVIDLSPTDWDNYVDAIWTLRLLSSKEGKERFNCPHFYNLDIFTTMHGVHSKDKRCDQNHFSLLQENAHHAWMTLFEKSLQCVHPSIAMPFYNVAKDWRKYYNPEVGVKSMLDSPIFGPDYYGGGYANFDDRDDLYDPYYVEDGRFANFPLRQNRTELCDESAGLFDDDYIQHCKEIMESGSYKGWRNADPTKSGIWVREPRDDSHYEYVSARRWHIFGDVGDTFLPNVVPTHEMINAMTSLKDISEQYKYISTAKIHGYAHKVMSGMWGGGINENTLVAPTAQFNVNETILETFRKGSGRLVLFAWLDELVTRDAGCYQCTKEGCFPDTENFLAKNCYNAVNGYSLPTGLPTDFKQPGLSDYTERGSEWYTYLEQNNIVSWMKNVLYGYGFHHANSGTFSRNAWANQDPMFYAHHAYTLLLNDFGTQQLVENGRATPPLYGLDEIIEERGVKECPGNNPTDVTVYRNVVRYKTGQEPGTNQPWDHILEMWTEERRDYEWIINDEFITSYDETIRYDESCREGCIDEALIIENAFIGTNMTLEEKCQTFVANLQMSTKQSKEDACAMRLKDIPGFGAWLPDRFDLFGYACKKTCNFCKTTCGVPQE